MAEGAQFGADIKEKRNKSDSNNCDKIKSVNSSIESNQNALYLQEILNKKKLVSHLSL